MAVGIGHDDPADRALADLDARCPEGGETVDFCSLIAVGMRSEVEMQPVLPVFGVSGGPPQLIFGPPCGDRIAVSWS